MITIDRVARGKRRTRDKKDIIILRQQMKNLKANAASSDDTCQKRPKINTWKDWKDWKDSHGAGKKEKQEHTQRAQALPSRGRIRARRK